MKNYFFITFISILLFNLFSYGNTIPTLVPLTKEEIKDLNYLREEEKLARDVYLYAYEKYQMRIFSNISQSEQTHMNRVLDLLTEYGFSDPASSQQGVFTNPELQSLYNSLTAQVDISLVEALKVGATIEDLDIKDIDDFIANTTKPDLLNVYNNLVCGSKNHMRAFNRQLKNKEVIYEPQYISKEELNLILSGSNGGCGHQ